MSFGSRRFWVQGAYCPTYPRRVRTGHDKIALLNSRRSSKRNGSIGRQRFKRKCASIKRGRSHHIRHRARGSIDGMAPSSHIDNGLGVRSFFLDQVRIF